MIQSILLKASPVLTVVGIIACMIGIPALISIFIGSLKNKKNEGVVLFWIFVIFAIIIVIATVKECSGFDMPYRDPRHT